MSESVEMETIADSCKLDEAEEATRSVQGQDEEELDMSCVYAAAQDAGSKKQTEVDNVNVDANGERQAARRISSREHKIIFLFGSLILVVMFGMVVFILLRLLKQV